VPRSEGAYDIGLIGLGVMGRNFAYNIADHDYSVAGYDRDPQKLRDFGQNVSSRKKVRPGSSLKQFVGLLRRPRAVVLLVPAGDAVDAVIGELLRHLEPGDLLVDSGNSRFTDTDRRIDTLAKTGLLFMGMGISGGAHGARHGPSLMPGGPREGYERVRPILEAVAARANGEPCVTYLGPRSSGHYVKMVHNGIEYGLMELIAETYDFMKRVLGLNAAELAAVCRSWNETELNGFLMEITGRIFHRKDEKSGNPLVEMILDRAMQKGTGEWTAWDALDLQVPTPTIDLAVVMRDLSRLKSEREAAAHLLPGPRLVFTGDRESFIGRLRNALYAAMIITYAQGMALLGEASRTYGYGLKLHEVARIWQGGCIIRARLLKDIRIAHQVRPELPNLLLCPDLGGEVARRQADLRKVVSTAAELGQPAPCLAVSLAYLDAYRSDWLPANLIQAQRDYFGAHTYERVDAEGVFHTEWDRD
jgi:6-phosphogluconate dehydrogenase